MRANHQEEVAVIARKLWLAAVVGWAMVSPAVHAQNQGSHPAYLPGSVTGNVARAPNQVMAEAIAACLRESGQLQHYAIDVRFQDGTAELTGRVAGAAQRDLALRLVQSVPGVDNVRDRLATDQSATVRAVQAVLPPPTAEPGAASGTDSPLPPTLPSPTPFAQPGFPPPPGQIGMPPEPTPIFQAGPGPDPHLAPPRMPPYAWPTHAPYNNYSRVAYPDTYPYQAWPFIGPMYPFPKVPPGWRKVTLEWQDGYWWYGRYASGH